MTQRPNVLFLVLDAVRRDHISCYGYERETTPNIDRLAADGVRYEHAIAPSVWTGAVHGAVFTGRYPSHTGIYGDSLTIPDDIETISDAFRGAGYRTFAASAGAHIRAGRGYDRGIDEYVETRRIGLDSGSFKKALSDRSFAKQVGFSLTRGPDDKTLYKYDRLKRFVEGAASDDDPFFGFINAKTAHSPYNPPRPYKGLFCEGFDRPRYEFVERAAAALGRDTQTLDGYDTKKLRDVSESGGDGVVAGAVEMDEREWDVLRAWYDGAVRYLDSRVGELVEFLRAQGVYEDTMIVVTADHGENFGDHGLTGHNVCLYDTLVRVPLIIKPAGESPSGRVIDEQVSLIDLEPTFRDAAGAPLDDYPHSESLLGFEDRRYHEHTFSEFASYVGRVERFRREYPEFDASQFVRTLQSVRDDEYKLIVDDEGNRELYAWRDDPAETRDIAADRPAVADELEATLRESFDPLERPGEFEAPDDDALKQQLEDLGYI